MSMQQRHLLKSEPWVSVCPLFPPHLRRQSAHPLSLDPESEMHHPLPVFPSPLLVQTATVPISVLRFYLSFPDPRVGGLRDKSVPVTLLTNRKSLISLWGKAPILSQILRPSSCQQPMLPAPLSPATLASVFSAKRLPSKAFKSPRLGPHLALYLDDSSFRVYPRFWKLLLPEPSVPPPGLFPWFWELSVCSGRWLGP